MLLGRKWDANALRFAAHGFSNRALCFGKMPETPFPLRNDEKLKKKKKCFRLQFKHSSSQYCCLDISSVNSAVLFISRAAPWVFMLFCLGGKIRKCLETGHVEQKSLSRENWRIRALNIQSEGGDGEVLQKKYKPSSLQPDIVNVWHFPLLNGSSILSPKTWAVCTPRLLSVHQLLPRLSSREVI